MIGLAALAGVTGCVATQPSASQNEAATIEAKPAGVAQYISAEQREALERLSTPLDEKIINLQRVENSGAAYDVVKAAFEGGHASPTPTSTVYFESLEGHALCARQGMIALAVVIIAEENGSAEAKKHKFLAEITSYYFLQRLYEYADRDAEAAALAMVDIVGFFNADFLGVCLDSTKQDAFGEFSTNI